MHPAHRRGGRPSCPARHPLGVVAAITLLTLPTAADAQLGDRPERPSDDPDPTAATGTARPPGASASSSSQAAELPYRAGDPIRPGYHLERTTAWGTVVPGAVLLTISYGASVALAVSVLSADNNCYDCSSPQGGWLVVPVFGPNVFSLTWCRLDECPGLHAVALLDASLQVLGGALLIVGLSNPDEKLVRDPSPRFPASWQLAPWTTGRDRTGFSLVGTF